jgi:hypothetical protein
MKISIDIGNHIAITDFLNNIIATHYFHVSSLEEFRQHIEEIFTDKIITEAIIEDMVFMPTTKSYAAYTTGSARLCIEYITFLKLYFKSRNIKYALVTVQKWRCGLTDLQIRERVKKILTINQKINQHCYDSIAMGLWYYYNDVWKLKLKQEFTLL